MIGIDDMNVVRVMAVHMLGGGAIGCDKTLDTRHE